MGDMADYYLDLAFDTDDAEPEDGAIWAPHDDFRANPERKRAQHHQRVCGSGEVMLKILDTPNHTMPSFPHCIPPRECAEFMETQQ